MNPIEEILGKMKGKRMEDLFAGIPGELMGNGSPLELEYRYVLVKAPRVIWQVLENWQKMLEIPMEDVVSLAIGGNHNVSKCALILLGQPKEEGKP